MNNMIKQQLVELASQLRAVGIPLEYESDYEYWNLHNMIRYTEVPYIGGGMYSGRDGHYFRHERYCDWDYQECEAILNVFANHPEFELIHIDGVEYDDDRIWKASINFAPRKK